MYEIFVKLLQEKGIKAAEVSRATGISQTVLSEWKKGKSTPKADKLQKNIGFFWRFSCLSYGLGRMGQRIGTF